MQSCTLTAAQAAPGLSGKDCCNVRKRQPVYTYLIYFPEGVSQRSFIKEFHEGVSSAPPSLNRGTTAAQAERVRIIHKS